MKLLNFSASICAALTLVSVACSSTTSDIMMGSDQGGSSAGDKPYAGSGNNSAGDRPIGGSSSASGGNESNGGEPTGGGTTSAGNPATGGHTTGGASVGGGASSGGASGGHGGSTSAGGGTTSAGGGSSSTGVCQADTDCVSCEYNKSPADAKACYCVGCDNLPMTKTQCDANQQAWLNACANVALPCPAIKCITPPDVACVNHQCVAK